MPTSRISDRASSALPALQKQIAAAAKAYRVAYSKFQEDKASSDYSIDHSALVYLMGKDGEYITHFAYGTPASKMTETLRRYL